jgi:hypothetical protein
MANNQHKTAFIQRLIGGIIFAAVLYFGLAWLGSHLRAGSSLLHVIGVFVTFASFYAPWQWFKWNFKDFLKQEGYTPDDYTARDPDQHFLHRANEIFRIMWLLTIPFFIICCFLTWHAVRSEPTKKPVSSNVIEENQLNDGRFKQGIIDGCKKSPGATNAFCGCSYSVMLAYYGDTKRIAQAVSKATSSDGKFDTNAFYTPDLVNKMTAQCTTS